MDRSGLKRAWLTRQFGWCGRWNAISWSRRSHTQQRMILEGCYQPSSSVWSLSSSVINIRIPYAIGSSNSRTMLGSRKRSCIVDMNLRNELFVVGEIRKDQRRRMFLPLLHQLQTPKLCTPKLRRRMFLPPLHQLQMPKLLPPNFCPPKMTFPHPSKLGSPITSFLLHPHPTKQFPQSWLLLQCETPEFMAINNYQQQMLELQQGRL